MTTYIWTHNAQGLSIKVQTPTEEQKRTWERFRVLDDDNIIYAEGYLNPNDNEATGFEPLDFAMFDAGCTSIQYLRKGRWETL